MRRTVYIWLLIIVAVAVILVLGQRDPVAASLKSMVGSIRDKAHSTATAKGKHFQSSARRSSLSVSTDKRVVQVVFSSYPSDSWVDRPPGQTMGYNVCRAIVKLLLREGIDPVKEKVTVSVQVYAVSPTKSPTDRDHERLSVETRYDPKLDYIVWIYEDGSVLSSTEYFKSGPYATYPGLEKALDYDTDDVPTGQ